MAPVLCDPRMPKDWRERERRLQLERQIELGLREPQLTEPQLLQMFARAPACAPA